MATEGGRQRLELQLSGRGCRLREVLHLAG